MSETFTRCPKCRTENIDNCHSMRCPMRESKADTMKTKSILPSDEEVRDEARSYDASLSFTDGYQVGAKSMREKLRPYVVEWIDCKERLPEPTGLEMSVRVLCFIPGDRINGGPFQRTMYYDYTDKRWYLDHETTVVWKVSHWMPLPPSPVKE
jgi:hypothetical protein